MVHQFDRRCDGVNRRDALCIGTLTGLGVGLVDFCRSQASELESAVAKGKSCILLWLDGGPSHLETFDLKPMAPAEVRGPFRPIDTNVSGIQFCELLQETAKQADKLAVIRSMTSPLGEHGLANQYVLSGYKPSSAVQYPSYGSVLAHLRRAQDILPPNIAIPETRFAGAGFLGNAYQPFVTGGDPASPDFKVQDLDFFPNVDATRLRRRHEYVKEFDAVQADFESRAVTTDSSFDRAYRLVTSREAKDSFDLAMEPAQVRSRYGRRTFGQSCLLARRLVERGVPFVSVVQSGWDTHQDLVLQLKQGYSGASVGVGLLPTFDLAFSALLADLSDRGMLDDTLVIAMGEFGRTPKINARGGRDHWPRVFSVVLAGGGIPGGQLIGASDRVGESPFDNPITPNDLARTIYTLLGVNPDHELHSPDGRSVPVNQGGNLIQEIVRS